jgi:hypothetical protein
MMDLGWRRGVLKTSVQVSAESEIFADDMVAKSELLAHYEKRSVPSEYGFWRGFHQCPIPY